MAGFGKIRSEPHFGPLQSRQNGALIVVFLREVKRVNVLNWQIGAYAWLHKHKRQTVKIA